MVDQLNCLHRNNIIPPEPAQEEDSNSDFWGKFERIQLKVKDINYILDEISKLDDESYSCVDQNKAADIRNDINNKISQIGAIGNQAKVDIEKLTKEIEDRDKENPGSPDIRLQKNHLHLLRTNFADVINHFSEVKSGIKNEFSNKIIRHYAISGVPIDEEKVTKIINENPEALQINSFVLSGGEQSQQVVQIYNRIASRHQEILEIETRLNELLELFVQFSILVHEQGRQIDNIEQNISTAKKYVNKGVKSLEVAQEHQKKSRKCIWVIVIIAVILLILVIVLSIVLTKK